jgi:hypothetical protein
MDPMVLQTQKQGVPVMLKKLIPAVLGLVVAVQTTSSFAGGMFFQYHNHYFPTSRVLIQPSPLFVQQQQYVIVKKWTPNGYVYVKQPLGLVRF